MKLSEYLSKKGHGSAVNLASSISGYVSDVCDWAKGNRPVPPARCVAIEKATDGKVTRRDLRPDDWQLIWPELVTRKSAARS